MILRAPGPLRTLIILVMVEAVTLAVVATFSERFSAPLAVVLAAIAVVEAEASWGAVGKLDLDRDRLRTLRLLEIGVALVLVRLGQALVADGAVPGFGWETALVMIIAVSAWNASTRTLADFDRLGDPPEREDRYIPPMESLWSRFSRGLVVMAATAVFASVPLESLFELSRDPVRSLFVPGLVYLVVGLTVLSAADFIDRRVRWQRDGVAGLGELAGEWRQGVLVRLTLAAGAVALLVFAAWGLVQRALFAPVATMLDAVSVPDFVFRSFGSEAPTADDGASAGSGGAPTGLDEGSIAREAYDRAFGVLVVLLLAYLLFRIVRAIVLSPPPALEVLSSGSWRQGWASVGRAFLAIPAALVAGLRGLLRWLGSLLRRDGRAGRRPRIGSGRRLAEGAAPDRRRLRIAELYHEYLELAGSRWRGRRDTETPIEFHDRSVRQLGEARRPARGLTGIFSEARWSGVEPTEADLARAEQLFDDIGREFTAQDDGESTESGRP